MKRFAALVAAVLMVVGALALRQARDDGDETADRPADAPRGIVCADDLADVCAAAGIDVVATAPAGQTADALIGADRGDDLGGSAWLVTSAWADLVLAERDRARAEPLVGVAGEPLASSPVVTAIWEDRASQLAERCGLPVGRVPGWRCLSEQVGVELAGRDQVRLASPHVDSALGLVVAAAQAAGLLGLTDFASNDFESGDFRLLADRVARGQVADPIALMLTRGPGAATASGIVRARGQQLPPRFGTTIRSEPSDPAVRADVVLVVPAGRSVGDDDRRALTDALLAAGWDPPAGSPAGLPSGGVLAAIRTLWAQSR